MVECRFALAVNVPTMPDSQNFNHSLLLVKFTDYPVIRNAVTPIPCEISAQRFTKGFWIINVGESVIKITGNQALRCAV